MDPADRNNLPCMKIPLYKSMVEYDENVKSYVNNPNDAAKSKITDSLDKCIDEYEKAITFLNSPPVQGDLSGDLSTSYLTGRSLDEWKRNLPTVINTVAALQLEKYSVTLKNMQTDNRYKAQECIIS